MRSCTEHKSSRHIALLAEGDLTLTARLPTNHLFEHPERKQVSGKHPERVQPRRLLRLPLLAVPNPCAPGRPNMAVLFSRGLLEVIVDDDFPALPKHGTQRL